MQVGPLLRAIVQNAYDAEALEQLHDQLSLQKARQKAKEEKRPIPEELPARSVALTPTERLQRLLQKTPPWELSHLQEHQDDSWERPFQQALTDPFCQRWFRRYYPQGVDKAPPFRGTWKDVIDRCQPCSFEHFHDTVLLQRSQPFRYYVATRRFCVVGEGQYLWIASRKRLWERKLHLSYLSPITAMAAFANLVYTGHAHGEVCRWDLDQGTYVFCRPKGKSKRPVSYLAVTRSHLYLGLSSDHQSVWHQQAIVYEGENEVQSQELLVLSNIIGVFTYAQKVKKRLLDDPQAPPQWIEEKYFIVSTQDNTISCWKSSSLIKGPSWKRNLQEDTSLVCGGVFIRHQLLVGGNHGNNTSTLYLINLEEGTTTVYRHYDDPIVRLEKVFHLVYCVTTKTTFLLEDERDVQFSVNIEDLILLEDEQEEELNSSFKFMNHFQGLYVKTATVQGEKTYQLILRDFYPETSIAQGPIVPAVGTSRKVAALVLACFAGLVVITT